MANLNILTTAPTTEVPRPDQAGAGYIDQCWYGSAPRWVLECLVSTAVMTATVYRWSEEIARWIPSSAGASSLAVGAGEVRCEDGGLPAYRCLVRSSGTGTGVYAPKGGRS